MTHRPSALASVAVALGVAALLTACGPSHPLATPTPTTSAAPSPKLGAAWQAVQEQVNPDGSVSTQTALQAFALAFGPLPGVIPPPGAAGDILDGTSALRWLVGHWLDITAEQRAAAVALIPNLANLPQVTGASTVHSRSTITVALRRYTQQRTDAFYTQLAKQDVAAIAAKVKEPMDLTVTAHVGVPVQATSRAETSIYNGSGGYSGTAAKCDIVVSALGDALQGDEVNLMMAHEAWHCFEGEYGGISNFWSSSRPGWIYEGEATWVGDTLVPNSAYGSSFWPLYLKEPFFPLFSRTYTALGFYAQLQQSGVDVWSKLIPVLQAKDNASAYQTAGGNTDAFLDLWASGYARDPNRGTAWDIDGPGITSDTATPKVLAVGDNATVDAPAPATANQIYAITGSSSEVLIVTSSGHARISDNAGKDYLVQGSETFCHKSSGCECPQQDTSTPPLLDLSGEGILLAVTGGPTGASGGVAGLSLMDYCDRGNLTGTWHGNWNENSPDSMAGTFTVSWVHTGSTVSGTIQVTGTECVSAGSVTGTVKGKTISFGAVQGLVSISYTGTYTKNTMSGTFFSKPCGKASGTWSAHRP